MREGVDKLLSLLENVYDELLDRCLVHDCGELETFVEFIRYLDIYIYHNVPSVLSLVPMFVVDE
jgi:hypothetical protein